MMIFICLGRINSFLLIALLLSCSVRSHPKLLIYQKYISGQTKAYLLQYANGNLNFRVERDGNEIYTEDLNENVYITGISRDTVFMDEFSHLKEYKIKESSQKKLPSVCIDKKKIVICKTLRYLGGSVASGEDVRVDEVRDKGISLEFYFKGDHIASINPNQLLFSYDEPHIAFILTIKNDLAYTQKYIISEHNFFKRFEFDPALQM